MTDIKDLEARIESIESWITEFNDACEVIEQELGEYEETFVPDEALLRDKDKDH